MEFIKNEREEKKNEINYEKIANKYGIEGIKDFADIMLNMMVASGDKGATIIKKGREIVELISKIQSEHSLKEDGKDLDQIIEFFEDKQKEIENFYKNLKEEN